ncbi:MAG: enoyl-CoA hydratase-related protein [Steroidobacteraceae bacterium]
MSGNANTPILVGVGEYSERIDSAGYEVLSYVDLAAGAARRACDDAASVSALAPHIDMVVSTRQFENSSPMAKAPFGRSNNFPRSVAQRLGANPARAAVEVAGGQSPQHLVNEFAQSIHDGAVKLVLLVGAEAMSTVRHLQGAKEKRDWSEKVEGTLEDRGYGLAGLVNRYEQSHQLRGAPAAYALCENARRARLELSRADYAKRMGELFAPFSQVAAKHPHSSSTQAYSAAELVSVSERNRMIADPYTRLLVARDQVNQASALVLTSVGLARELGIAESKWVYLHGCADARERALLERPDMSSSPAAIEASRAALAAAGIDIGQVDCFDLYSCFPIPVFNVLDAFGLSANDPRGFTLTGGLPYFGGAGNNYSMHGIAAAAARARATPGTYAFVGANGGVMSKYSVGIYSTRARDWQPQDSTLQARLDAVPTTPIAYEADGPARVETYTIVYDKGVPAYGVVVGRLESNDARFLALTPENDAQTLQQMVAQEPLNQRIYVRSFGSGNRFTFARERLFTLYPEEPKILRSEYQFCRVERREHVLEVTIDRPAVRNCLHAPAHEELSAIFDTFFADPDLWVAIITGAGTEAFCAGNDLKYQSPMDTFVRSKSGFGGLTSRRERNKPVIAAVNGFAMGGGFEICLASDLVVADENALFALSEVKVGLIAGAGGLIRLPRQIPKKQAMEMILTGRRVSAAEGKTLGWVNRITPPGQALEGARQLAAEILDGSPVSVQCSLQAINDSEGSTSVLEALLQQADAVDRLITSEDMIEGFTAFGQKRKPRWKGR